ncbi:hypothetical protein CRE_03203 [Caenorhabditis remanei]|uniref:Uncharacterized protein n=1 Tax=Caenorhabditis remanei TaxID=31234 RepID=E3MMP5_CAERE|nr:hypothetical protein CRE_03203 [Caenorhabditis remanei]
MRSLLILLVLAAVAYSQNSDRLRCGFSCSRRTVVSALIDGAPGTATCSENTSPSRCRGCCRARALQEGLTNVGIVCQVNAYHETYRFSLPDSFPTTKEVASAASTIPTETVVVETLSSMERNKNHTIILSINVFITLIFCRNVSQGA